MNQVNVGIAVILSFLFPGLGHFYIQKFNTGIKLMILYAISLLLCFIFVELILVPIVWIYGMTSVYKDAGIHNRFNRGEEYI
jgi:TM2 domain-containing membrane protein YozV